MNIHIDPRTTVSFTGYRPEKIIKSYTGTSPDILNEIYQLVCRKVELLYEQGYKTYLTGMAAGFDLIAALAVLDCQTKYEDIRLVAVIPYADQPRGFTADWKQRYREVLKQAAYSIILSPYKTPGIYYKRNDYLLESSSKLICYYDGQRGGTKYTVDRAIKLGHSIHNLYTETSGLLF